ncbi:hypothetical protein DQ181_08605 [Enterococcus faecium]|nr:hypothetical protein [Enterococcus faecium]
MKKRFVLLLSLVLGVLVVAGCSSNKKSDDTQKVIDKIVKHITDVDNVDYDKGKEKYHYTEKDFSFLIYYDKDQKLYLIDSWTPYKGDSNDMREKYEVSLDEDKLEKVKYDSDFNDYKKFGDFEVVYKSGKFEE